MHELSDDVSVAIEGGEAFLLDVSTGRYFGLNPAGLVVWRALEQGADPLEDLRATYPTVPAAVLEADAEALLERLLQAGLCRVRSTG